MGFGKVKPVIRFYLRDERVPAFVNSTLAAELRAEALQAAQLAGATTTRIGRSRWSVVRSHLGDRGVLIVFIADVTDLTPSGYTALLTAGEEYAQLIRQIPFVQARK